MNQDEKSTAEDETDGYVEREEEEKEDQETTRKDRMKAKGTVAPKPLYDQVMDQSVLIQFLDGSAHLYMRVCPSVCWMVRPMDGP